jgi:hypothetical protein
MPKIINMSLVITEKSHRWNYGELVTRICSPVKFWWNWLGIRSSPVHWLRICSSPVHWLRISSSPVNSPVHWLRISSSPVNWLRICKGSPVHWLRISSSPVNSPVKFHRLIYVVIYLKPTQQSHHQPPNTPSHSVSERKVSPLNLLYLIWHFGVDSSFC